jgi:hypothetical protein
MITFRKYAFASTDCHVSLLGRLPRRGRAGVRLAALIILLLAASATAFATPRHGKQVREHKAVKPPTQARAEETDLDAKVPIRLTRLDTPDGPCIIADIGEFPSDLNEAGQAFLEREFFEHFATDVLGLDDSQDSATHATLKVAMLPQEKENVREGDFIFGKVRGHIIVLVEKRHVMVACVFEKEQSQPQQMAAVKTLIERLAAG